MAEIQQVKLPVVLRVVDGVDILEHSERERNKDGLERDVGQLHKHNPGFGFFPSAQFIKSRELLNGLLTHWTSSLQPIPL